MDLNKATSISFYLRTGRIHIFTDAIRTIGEPSFIRFLLNQDGTSMIIEPYHTKEFQSIKEYSQRRQPWNLDVNLSAAFWNIH